MPVFSYKGFDAKGKSISGEREADSPRNLRFLLRKEGIILNNLEESQSKEQSNLSKN